MNIKHVFSIPEVFFIFLFSGMLSPAMGICLGQVSAEYTAWATNQCSGSGYETPVKVTSGDPSIAVVSRTVDGPWVESITFPVLLVPTGDGFCSWQPQDGNGVRWWYKGLTPGSTSITQATYIGSKVIDVEYFDCSPPQVESIQELPADENLVPSPLDSNPLSAGGGTRIYPGKEYPGETADRATIKLRVSTNKPNKIVYFKSFDPDDPSSDDMQVDFNLDGADDNRGVPNVGELDAPFVTTDADGVAEVNFTVTKHPGDNFIVAASFDPDALDTFTTIGTQVVNAEGTPLPVDGAVATELITVWRKLHLEVDRMDRVQGNYVLGTVKNSRYRKKTDDTKISLIVSSKLEVNRFTDGDIVIEEIGYTVLENGRNYVMVDGNKTMAKGVPFVLFDDDDYNRNDGDVRTGDEDEDIVAPPSVFDLMKVSDSHIDNVLAQAFIVPAYDGGGNLGNNEVIPFKLNIANTNSELERYINPAWDILNERYRQSHLNESDDYWVGYLLLAYQGDESLDFDPNPDSITLSKGLAGVTNGADSDFTDTVSRYEEPPRGGEGSIIFLETMRDIIDNNYDNMSPAFDMKTAAHELAHQFGLNGDDILGEHGIMSYGDYPLVFSPAHINIIRNRVRSPGQP